MSGARPKDPGRKFRLPEHKKNHVKGAKPLSLDRDGEYHPASGDDVENWTEVRPNRSQRLTNSANRGRGKGQSRPDFNKNPNKFQEHRNKKNYGTEKGFKGQSSRAPRSSNVPRNHAGINGNSKANVRPLRLQELRQILAKHSVKDVTKSLLDKVDELNVLLNSDKVIDEVGLIEVLIRIFVRVFEYGASGSTKTIANIITESTFLKKGFITYVTHYADNLKKDEKNKGQTIKNIEENVDLLIKFLEAFIPDMIGHVNDIDISVTLLDLKCQELFRTKMFSKEALVKVMRLKKKIKEEVAEAKEKEKKMRQLALAEREGIFDGPPPDDYRDIPILPTPDDLHSSELPFLRPNITKGSYSSHYHYLDVQFRLLREDFVCPLRDGIQTHLSNLTNPLPRNQRKRNTDVRLYYDVTIEHPVFTHREEGVLYRVKFSLCNLKGIKWQTTKRLMYGSLVCLSHDRFKTLLFGTVTEREENLLRSGIVDIKLHNVDNMDPASVYTMVESTAFYESYRPVLQVLQQFNEGSIPLENYIVRASHDIQQPRYLRDQPGLKYNIKSLIKCRKLVQYNRERLIRCNLIINILDEDAWPDTKKLGLDASQLSAVKLALTKELAVIQGPPGTGKTYIGLKIVETLLINKNNWKVAPDDRYPSRNTIMIICYTNHALDQFLEGILEFCSKKIVRIGGRSKSEILEEFNLRKLAKKKRRFRDDDDFQEIIDGISNRMIEAEEMMKLCDKYIVSEYTLSGIINDKHFRCLSDSREEYGIDGKRSSLPTWLGLLSTSDLNQDVVDGDEVNEENVDEDEQDEEHEADTKNIETEFDMLLKQREYEDVNSEPDFKKRKEKIIARLYSALAYDPEMKCQNAPLEKHRATVLKELSIKDDAMTEEDANRCSNIRQLSRKDRWRLYRYWITKYKVKWRQVLFEQQGLYDNLVGRSVRQQLHKAKCNVLRGAHVIGMTTTGAAKNKELLNDVQPRIVIVEEAAEILEAHIVTSLTRQCEHLILIGDHQQLKPNPTVYKLATKFNLDTSLFERMLNNNIPCQKLSSQHRMRPEIADIMRNHFYNHLLDDESVKNFDNVRGVSHNLYFINHNFQEQSDEDILSKSNVHEAEYCVALAKYLVQQGYDASEITVLTTYTGQVLNIKGILKSKKYDCLCDIHVTAVDNYQGEENEIILLSLVRSNEAGNIGFLKVSNRMCVALSRARKGLFCIGNFNLLSKSNKLWMKIVKDMRSKSRAGNHLELYCRNHPERKVNAFVADDFDKCPLGGCKLKCETRLDCGHVCPMLCHPRDRNHKKYKCREKCVRECTRGHVCQLKCFEDCACKIVVNKTFIECQHEIQIECNMFDKSVDCTNPCDRLLKCRHGCRKLCYEECTTECKEIVTKSFMPCGHIAEVQCYIDTCQVPCEKKLPCGHNCKNECGDLTCTVKCIEVIDKTFPCGHTVNIPCFTPTCTLPCSKERACGHSCPKQCGDLCGECLVEVNKELTCGHHKILPCHEDVLEWTKRCSKTCSKVLSCGHTCKSECSIPCSTSRCTELVTKKLVCDHEKHLPCNVDPNKPLELSYSDIDPHMLRCESEVNLTRKCGHTIIIECWKSSTLDSIDCSEKVVETLSCGHSTTRFCSETGFCYERCTRLLSCGHKCKELCSKPCTDKCNVKVEKKLKCEHMKTVRCFVDVSQTVTMGEAACHVKKEVALPCGHKETQLCCQSDQPVTCKQQCLRKLACGHLCTKKCVEECSVDSCKQRCKFTLACRHRCEGICKDCLNGHFHSECKKRCNKRLVCGHSCQQYCSLIPCQPCKQQCQSLCRHKRCKKTCLEICEPCKSPCGWQCSHLKCTKACHEFCNRDRCNLPCKKTLKCKHKCVALCGERCVCLKCDPRNSISLITVSGPSQNYVFLYDCTHAIEVSKMDQYMDKDEGIRRKECPLCETPITYNPRYGNVLKTIEMRITAVKQKAIAERSMKQIQEKRKNILSKLSVIQNFDKQSRLLEEINSRNGIAYVRLLCIDIIITVLERLQKIREQAILLNERKETSRAEILKDLDKLQRRVVQLDNIASEQVLVDLASELKRLSICVQLKKRVNDTVSDDSTNISSLLSTILYSKLRVSQRTYKEAFGLLGADSLTSNESLVEVAEKTFETCLSFCRDDWSSCPVSHVFSSKHRGKGYRCIIKCQQCTISKENNDDGSKGATLVCLPNDINESKTKQNAVMPDVQEVKGVVVAKPKHQNAAKQRQRHRKRKPKTHEGKVNLSQESDTKKKIQKLQPTDSRNHAPTEKKKHDDEQLKDGGVLSLDKNPHTKCSNKNDAKIHGDKYVASKSKHRSTTLTMKTKTTATAREPTKDQQNRHEVEKPNRQNSNQRKQMEKGKGRGSGKRSDRR